MSRNLTACSTFAFLVASLSIALPGRGAASEEGTDFPVDSAEREDYRGTKEDVESNLTDKLAIKLRQFDEWTIKGEDQTAAQAGKRGGAARGADGTTGSDSTGGSAANPQELPDSQTQLPQTPASPTGTPPARSSEELGASSPHPPAKADTSSKEDEVARMIREAAEQETDPDRRRELMEQYDAYMANR